MRTRADIGQGTANSISVTATPNAAERNSRACRCQSRASGRHSFGSSCAKLESRVLDLVKRPPRTISPVHKIHYRLEGRFRCGDRLARGGDDVSANAAFDGAFAKSLRQGGGSALCCILKARAVARFDFVA